MRKKIQRAWTWPVSVLDEVVFTGNDAFLLGGGVGICLEIRARFQTARRVLLVPNAKWFDKYPYYTVHSARYYGTVRMNAV